MWWKKAQIYQVFPLGFCDCPRMNDRREPGENRFQRLMEIVDKAISIGSNTLLLGPVFQSESHGYETKDYYQTDFRLGSTEDMLAFFREVKSTGMRVVLDGVFNHVGRGFWAFQDLLGHGEKSRYRDWFRGVDFAGNNPLNDGFDYHTWEGHYELVALNHQNPEVVAYLLGVVDHWANTQLVDGFRLDAADVLEEGFRRALAEHVHRHHPDFWLMAEVIHGDYRNWAGKERLDSTTNYELYKGMWSSLNDGNYFEVAYSLNRMFGEGGMYRDLDLHTFVDNHDVNRAASTLDTEAHLFPLYGMLFTAPGIPGVYYGSENGIPGRKGQDDWPLRPNQETWNNSFHLSSDLRKWIAKLSRLRRENSELQEGDYRELFIDHKQFGFLRETHGKRMVVLFNAESQPIERSFALSAGSLIDVFTGEILQGPENHWSIEIPSYGTKILKVA